MTGFQAGLPSGQGNAEAPEQFLVRQARICRAARGRRMLARRDRHDAGRRFGPFEPGDLSRKSVPGRGSRRRSVVDAARVSERGGTMTPEKLRGRVRESPGAGRRSDLIGYNAQFFFFLKQTPNSEKEIPAARRIHPARAQYQMRAADVVNRLLSGELAAAVGAEGVGAVLLDIRRIFRSVEDVIGRIVEEQRSDPLRLFGQDGDRGGIDVVSGVRFAFRTVDSRISRRIDEHFGPNRANDRDDPVWNCEVETFSVKGDDFAERSEGMRELPADLPALSSQQNLH